MGTWRGQNGCWRCLTGALVVGALLLLSLAPILPHHRGAPATAVAATAEGRGHHAGHHQDGPAPAHERPLAPHCPLCTLATGFLLPEPALVPLPFRRGEAAEAVRPVAARLALAPASGPQQPRAPPRLG